MHHTRGVQHSPVGPRARDPQIAIALSWPTAGTQPNGLRCVAMDTLFGLPAHPFLVHVPLVLIPLAAVGVVFMVIKPVWHERYRWVVLALGAVGTLGAILAASAGDSLADRIIDVAGPEVARRWEEHAERGETARNIAIVFFIVLAAYVLVPWLLQRRQSDVTTMPAARMRTIRIALAALAIVGAAASVTTITLAGHSGSDAVWSDYVRSSP